MKTKKLSKEDELFWSNFPIQPGHPKFKPNFFKQLFCNHKYGNFQHENGWCTFLMCKKCGKKTN